MFPECPTRDDVFDTFRKHYDYYQKIDGIAAESAANGETAISRQYAGRVPFELLQNALDRADKQILVKSDAASLLVVANDGAPVSCNPAFNLSSPINIDTNKPSDFHSLCSMHTSNKDPEKDNGNKGVGFRSVFSVSSRVYVWSRLRDGTWWGILLLRDPSHEEWRAAIGEPAVARGLEQVKPEFLTQPPCKPGERRPSFHFPLPLCADIAPVEGADWAKTIIELRHDADHVKDADSIRQSIASLQSSHLEFVGLRAKAQGQAVRVEIAGTTKSTTTSSQVQAWTALATDVANAPLFDKAKRAGLKLNNHISGAIRWPADGAVLTGKIYCYLATEVPCPFGIDIHADLQTGIDRKHLEVKDTEDVGNYNRDLLLRSIDLHFDRVQSSGPDRDDIWSMLDPGVGVFGLKADDDPVRFLLVRRMRDHIFGGTPFEEVAAWNTWARIASESFNSRRALPARTYRQFWTATENWIHSATSNARLAKKIAEACLLALDGMNARVVPIVGHDEADEDELKNSPINTAILPPKAGTTSAKLPIRLFNVSRAQREQFAVIEMPVAVTERACWVTTWAFPEAFIKDGRLIGSLAFQRAPLLQQLRQLPTILSGAVLGCLHATESVQRQYALIEFAARLFTLTVTDGKGVTSYATGTWEPGWRADHAETPTELHLAGRAVATLFLPTSTGKWAPARQVKKSQLATQFLDMVCRWVSADKMDTFLCFLGVATLPGELPLVEGGALGVIEPLDLPPSLCNAEPGHAIPAVSIPIAASDHQALLARLDAAWAHGWFARLAKRESEFPNRIKACEELGKLKWIPVGGEGDFAQPPKGMASTPNAISPDSLTLLAKHPVRMADGLWRVSLAVWQKHEWLKSLGACSIEDRLDTDGRVAIQAIHSLKLAYPDVNSAVRQYPSLRYTLADLFSRALDTVIQHKEKVAWLPDLPLLAEWRPLKSVSSSCLLWRTANDVYVAKDNNDRESIRRYTENVTLLTAVVGEKNATATPIEKRLIAVSSVVTPDEVLVSLSRENLHKTIAHLLPVLLAVAEQSRRFPLAVNASLVAERWRDTEIVQVRDVWRKWNLIAMDGAWHHDERRGQFNDVMYTGGHKREDSVEPAFIYYDVKPDQLGKIDAYPPLIQFAEALAAILLDGRVEPDWQAALAAYGSGDDARLIDYLERIGVSQDLVDAMQAGLTPVTEPVLSQHKELVASILSQFGLCLIDHAWDANGPRTLYLGKQVSLAGGSYSSKTEDDVNDAFTSADFGQAAKFSPRLDVVTGNQKTWSDFIQSQARELRILRYQFDRSYPTQALPRDSELLAGELAHSLAQHANSSARKINFDAESVVREWLAGTLPTGPLDDWLPPIVAFSVITSRPIIAQLANQPYREWRSSTSVGAPITEAERAVENAKKVAKGDGAEEAILVWLAKETSEIIGKHADIAWTALGSAFPKTGSARDKFEIAKRSGGWEDLKAALWVARSWRGAGFDMVGLEVQVNGLVQPVRYEVKALGEESLVRIFVSKNEIAVYRETCGKTPKSRPDLAEGTWDLVGVRPESVPVVLTGALFPVIDPAGSGLDTLKAAGFSPESLELVVKISPNAPTPDSASC
jgi:hypothetical protein